MKDDEYTDSDEILARANGLCYVKFDDGNIGSIANGAGLAMATLDSVRNSGGYPTCFFDIGGRSSPDKVYNAIKIILKNKKVRVILINVLGGITKCDDIAKGVIRAKDDFNMRVPLLVRLIGTNDEEASELLSQDGISTYSDMQEVVSKAVALTR